MVDVSTSVTSAPMEGHGGYNRSSRVQAAGSSPALPLLEHAARIVTLAEAPAPIVIADYGASAGRNSLAPMAVAIGALRDRVGPKRAISVIHTDLPDSDFAALFQLLASNPESYVRLDSAAFASAVGRSFYSRSCRHGVRVALLVRIEEVVGRVRHECLITDVCRRGAPHRRRNPSRGVQPLDVGGRRQRVSLPMGPALAPTTLHQEPGNGARRDEVVGLACAGCGSETVKPRREQWRTRWSGCDVLEFSGAFQCFTPFSFRAGARTVWGRHLNFVKPGMPCGHWAGALRELHR